MNIKFNIKNSYQFLKFGLVGFSNTVISTLVTYLVIFLCNLYLTPHLSNITNEFSKLLVSQIANLIGFIVGVLNSYYWNNKYVFTLEKDENRNTLKTFIKTFIAYASTGILLNGALLILWVNVLHISQYIGPIINLIITIPLNYVINKYWAYKKTHSM
ncbi:GtrA family protein [Clostridium felsineum]|uniref:Uncharacterized protein n=1 Tax=Clostridium felsineum TaxID=36839 RepID=A0A1S8LYT2_9CLOT|nr:GtrA family protein [Clostridium felsineum]MCR3760024.1 GtrA family protein [Clostridium felsineum]URZ09048.1 hypothetical protein CLROS_044640 [Clostridium felsineum]URZ13735.1 hypothetical protein CROST_045130 [Clostridium felsineum]